MHVVRQLPALFVRDVDSLPLAFLLRGKATSNLLSCFSGTSTVCVSSWAAVFRDVVDARMSEVRGPGTVGFVRHDSAQNFIRVVPCLPSGALVDYATVDDVHVAVVGGRAAVTVGASGSFDCVYTVDEGVLEVGIRIRVCGVLVWAGLVQACEITGRHKH